MGSIQKYQFDFEVTLKVTISHYRCRNFVQLLNVYLTFSLLGIVHISLWTRTLKNFVLFLNKVIWQHSLAARFGNNQLRSDQPNNSELSHFTIYFSKIRKVGYARHRNNCFFLIFNIHFMKKIENLKLKQ